MDNAPSVFPASPEPPEPDGVGEAPKQGNEYELKYRKHSFEHT